MSGTRRKILKAARFLFNGHGVAKVSQRAIAEHIAISPGNLTYHFKKRDDIIEALYFELVEAMDESFALGEGENPGLVTLMEMTKSMNKNLFEYRFFMIDFIQVLRSNKKIKKHFAGLTDQRNAQMRAIMKQLIENGIIRDEELPNEYNYLFKRFQLFGDFWIASIGMTREDIMLKHTRMYTEILMQSIYPYLTTKGKKEFKMIMNYD